MNSKTNIKAVALVAMACSAIGARAQVVNGGFEANIPNSTTFTGYNRIGLGYVADTTHYQNPTQGNNQAALATILDGNYGDPYTQSGNFSYGVSASNAENFLQLDSGSLSGVGNGTVTNVSAITQTIHLNAGDKLLFDFAMLTNQVYNTGGADSQRPNTAYDDFSFLSISGAASSSVYKLADVFSGYHDLVSDDPAGFTTNYHYDSNSDDPFLGESDYATYTFTATTAGDYLFGFGVTSAYTGASQGGVNSGLLLDNLHVVPSLSTVPGPGAVTAFGLGLLGRARRRRRA